MHHGKSWEERQGGLISGVILILMGVYFLLWQLGYLPGLHKLWPLILIIVGLALIIGHFRTPSQGGGGGEPGGRPPQAAE